MNHYPHHIGDFNNATRHLTRVERSLYSDMLDLYYDTEQPLNGDVNKLARRLLANSEEEREAVQVVLDEFFTLENDGWHNPRCDAEIAKYQGLIETASRAGRASAEKRKSKKAANESAHSIDVEHDFNDRSTPVEFPLNQPEPEPEPEPEPNINTEEEKKVEKKESPQAAGAAPPDGGVAGLQNKKPEKPKSEESEAGFEKFWQVWPKSDRKQAKGLCLKAWKKAGAERHAADILAHIEACKRSENWSKEGGQFIPAPLVYLNQKRWEGAELAESVAAGESKFGSGFEGVM